MSWFAELAGKAENILQNIDEQTGVAIRNHKSRITKDNKPKGDQKSLSRSPEQNKISKFTFKKSNETTVKTIINVTPASKGVSKPIKNPNILNTNVNNTNTKKIKKSPRCTTQSEKLMLDVEDEKLSDNKLRRRRNSNSPTKETNSKETALLNDIQALDVENAMLKNEMNVMNRETTELFKQMKKNEEENIPELQQAYVKESVLKEHNEKLEEENINLKDRIETWEREYEKYFHFSHKTSDKDAHSTQVSIAKNNDRDIMSHSEPIASDPESFHRKLENELRNANYMIEQLRNETERAKTDYEILVSDWKTYKGRVKGMLTAKDDEIKRLLLGKRSDSEIMDVNKEVNVLRKERDSLQDQVGMLLRNYDVAKATCEKLEHRLENAERVSMALRNTLKEERVCRNQLENDVCTLNKELKNLQLEYERNQMGLLSKLREKDEEIQRLFDSTSTVQTKSSTLNVADWDKDIDRDKIAYLTDTLMQKQEKIESLMADNNILRLQYEKVESKLRTKNMENHSVYSVPDHNNVRLRYNTDESMLVKFYGKLNLFFKRYPMFLKIFTFYVVGIHFWVLTVLLSRAPDYSNDLVS